MVSAAGDFFFAKFFEINVVIQPSCYFHRQVSLNSCFLLFFFVKDEIASFQLKQIIVFLNYRKCSVCVFISLHDCDRV